ncbi:hypothetical protein BLNAU_14058 [Blattamonas nauphoetae]|uniref:Transmembrane protein n=1 Tax=Blattamonas nauphoetae TaxID=2049346 RepID=A0ABQ9XLF8_9EUKA|nr:hypothetical protein BLNAU_14058 [Blattamonas nauphoetae]
MESLKATIKSLTPFLLGCSVKILLPVLAFIFPTNVLNLLVNNPEKKPFSPVSLLMTRWSCLFCVVLALLEYQSLRPVLRHKAEPRALEVLRLGDTMNLLLLLDFGLLGTMVFFHMTVKNVRPEFCALFEFVLVTFLILRSAWLRITSVERETFETQLKPHTQSDTNVKKNSDGKKKKKEFSRKSE